MTGSVKSKMAASQLPEMYISACTQDINEIPTDMPMFFGSNYQIRIVAMLYDQTGRNRIWKNQMVLMRSGTENWTLLDDPPKLVPF